MDDDLRAALERGDDESAFTLLRDRHGRAMFTRCFHLLGDRALAEDALQETLIMAFRRRAELRSVVNLRGWLMCVATNKALDLLRRAKRDRAKLDRQRQAEAGDETSTPPAPGEGLARYDRASLDECLAALDPVTRAAFLLRHEDELPWEQIATRLGVPVDTIRMRVQRGAMQSLRTCLEAKA